MSMNIGSSQTIRSPCLYCTLDLLLDQHRGVAVDTVVSTKVMFLSAVTRPRFDNNKVCVVDGKIGIWQFVRQVPVQRTCSIYQPAGTTETKSLPVTKQTYADIIMSNFYLQSKRSGLMTTNKCIYSMTMYSHISVLIMLTL